MVTSLQQRSLPVQESNLTRFKNNAYYYKRQLQRWTFHPLVQNPLLFMMIATALSTTFILWQILSANYAALPSPLFIYPLAIDQANQFLPLTLLPYLLILKNIPAMIAVLLGYWLAQREQTYLSTFLFICVTVCDLLLSLMVITYLHRLL